MAHLLLPDSSLSSPTASMDSPTESSVDFISPPDSQSNRSDPSVDSSSSFSTTLVPEIDSSSSFSTYPVLDTASGQRSSPKKEKKKQQMKKNVLKKASKDDKMDDVDLKQRKKAISKEHFRDRTRAKKGYRHNACCTCVGGIAADCTALCCCPFVIIPLLAFVLVELPSALACKMVVHFKKMLCIKGSLATGNNKGGEESHRPAIFTPTWSYREPHDGAEGEPAAHIVLFDTQNLLKHFDEEQLGFGCLSQRRD